MNHLKRLKGLEDDARARDAREQRTASGLARLAESGALVRSGETFLAADGKESTERIAAILTRALRRMLDSKAAQ